MSAYALMGRIDFPLRNGVKGTTERMTSPESNIRIFGPGTTTGDWRHCGRPRLSPSGEVVDSWDRTISGGSLFARQEMIIFSKEHVRIETVVTGGGDRLQLDIEIFHLQATVRWIVDATSQHFWRHRWWKTRWTEARIAAVVERALSCISIEFPSEQLRGFVAGNKFHPVITIA